MNKKSGGRSELYKGCGGRIKDWISLRMVGGEINGEEKYYFLFGWGKSNEENMI